MAVSFRIEVEGGCGEGRWGGEREGGEETERCREGRVTFMSRVEGVRRERHRERERDLSCPKLFHKTSMTRD